MTTETTQEAGTRYRTKSETVTAIQLTEDNGPAVLAFCGIPEVPGLSATVRALPGPGGTKVPVNLRPGDWIVKRGSGPHEYFSVHGPTAFAMAYERPDPLADPMFAQAYMDVQKVLDGALGTEEEDGTGGGIASEVWLLAHQRDEARAERDRLRNGGRELGRITARLYRSMRAAAIEMARNGPHAGMQWILNSIPPPVDEGDGLGWDGKETARQWFDRVEAADAEAEAGAPAKVPPPSPAEQEAAGQIPLPGVA